MQAIAYIRNALDNLSPFARITTALALALAMPGVTWLGAQVIKAIIDGTFDFVLFPSNIQRYLWTIFDSNTAAFNAMAKLTLVTLLVLTVIVAVIFQLVSQHSSLAQEGYYGAYSEQVRKLSQALTVFSALVLSFEFYLCLMAQLMTEKGVLSNVGGFLCTALLGFFYCLVHFARTLFSTELRPRTAATYLKNNVYLAASVLAVLTFDPICIGIQMGNILLTWAIYPATQESAHCPVKRKSLKA